MELTYDFLSYRGFFEAVFAKKCQSQYQIIEDLLYVIHVHKILCSPRHYSFMISAF